MIDLHDLLPILDGWAAEGQAAALCTVVAVHGRAPLPLGATLAVAADGRTAGAVSGGCVEREVIEVAQQVLHGAVPQRMRFSPSPDGLAGSGLPCGGGIDVWVQPWGSGPLADAQAAFADDIRAERAARWAFHVGPVAGSGDPLAAAISEPTAGVPVAGGPFELEVLPPGRLVLVGAGPVAGALAALAPTIGLRPVVVDPRPAIAAHAPIGAASELLLCWPGEAFERLGVLGARDAVVVLSHQPAIDDAALLAALDTGAGFIGALGSRDSHAARLSRLRDRGIGPGALGRIVGPVGLDLGGWAPAEVALSIAAELVAVRHGRTGGRLTAARGPLHDTHDRAAHALGHPVAAATAGRAERRPVERATIQELEAATPGFATGTSTLTAVVMAAGAGRRFGGAKQAAQWQGESLVARAVRAAAGGLPEGTDIVVVVGAHEQTVREALPPEVPHRVVVAGGWAEGLGASLQAGLAAVSTPCALVLLADQPLVDAELVAHVARAGSTAIGAGAAAARPFADGVPGHPVLLGPIALTRAADLRGDTGLAPLLQTLHVHRIEMDDLASIIDIDQPADLLRAGPDQRPARPARPGKARGMSRPAPQSPAPARQRRGSQPGARRERPWT